MFTLHYRAIFCDKILQIRTAAFQNVTKTTFKSERIPKFQRDFSEIFATEVAIFGHIFATYVVNLLKEFNFLS